MHLKYWSFLVCFAAPAPFWHCEHGQLSPKPGWTSKTLQPRKQTHYSKCLLGSLQQLNWLGKKKKKKKNPLWQIKIRLFQRMRKEQAEETSWCLKGTNLPSSLHNFLLYYCLIVMLLGFCLCVARGFEKEHSELWLCWELDIQNLKDHRICPTELLALLQVVLGCAPFTCWAFNYWTKIAGFFRFCLFVLNFSLFFFLLQQ